MIRRILIVSFAILAFVLPGGAPALAEAFRTKAPYSILVDYGSGAVLFAKNADGLMQPASTTKILTAEIVLRQLVEGRLKLADSFAVSPHAAQEGSAASGGSSMFLQANTRVSVDDLLHGLLIDSGNDAAIALAEGVAGSEGAFAKMMTQRARELGMMRSRFANPWGDGGPGQRVTAREMARLAAHVIRTYPQFYGYFSEREFTWNGIRQQNRNPLLGMNVGADGLKTGHLAASGFGLVGSAVQNGRRLILVLNGLKTDADRGIEARRLIEWGFAGNTASQAQDEPAPKRKACGKPGGRRCASRSHTAH